MPRNFRTGSALLLSGARAASLLGFVVATAMLSRALPPADYGTFRQCWTVYLLAIPIACTGLTQSLFYFVPLSEGASHWALVRRTLLIALLVGLAIAAGAAAGAGALARIFSNSEAALAFGAFGLFLGASVPTQLADGIFMSVGRAGPAAVFNVLNRTVVLLGLAVPIVVLRWGFTNALLALGLVQALAVAGLWIAARKAHEKGGVAGAPAVPLAAQWRYAAPVVAASLCGAVFMQMDKLIIGTLMSPAEFAVYSNGAFENPVVALVVTAASATAASELVRLRAAGDRSAFLDLWSQMSQRIAMALLPMGTFLFAFASETVIALFSARYADSAAVFRIYVALTPVRIIAFSMLLAALNRNGVYLVGHLVAGASLAILAPVLFRAVGVLGPAVGLVVTSYALAVGYLWVVARDLGTTFGRMLPYRSLAQILVTSIASAAIARACVVRFAGMTGVPALAAGAALFGACTVLGSYLLRVAGISGPKMARDVTARTS